MPSSLSHLRLVSVSACAAASFPDFEKYSQTPKLCEVKLETAWTSLDGELSQSSRLVANGSAIYLILVIKTKILDRSVGLECPTYSRGRHRADIMFLVFQVHLSKDFELSTGAKCDARYIKTLA